jgi:23S rRNA (cytosine1962-C5)-methyltransferase
MFRNRLEKVFRHRSKVARKQGITCYRIYDHDLPEFPLIIELYESHVYISEYMRSHSMSESEHDQWLTSSITAVSEVLQVPVGSIHSRLRQRKQGRQGQYQKLGDEKNEFVVMEGGLKFIVNLTDYLDTGLFLDHRITRSMVREIAKEKAVLNLFCYTGSFSVYAASGFAKRVTSVDLSNTYLEWAKRNMTNNGFTGDAFEFIATDVMSFLPSLTEETYDVIIADPPTFSNSKKMDDIFDVQRDHVVLINHCLRILRKGGKLFFSTNNKKFQLTKEAINAASVKDITAATTPFDFAGKLNRFCFVFEK